MVVNKKKIIISEHGILKSMAFVGMTFGGDMWYPYG